MISVAAQGDEKQFAKLKNKAKIISLDNTRNGFAGQITKIQNDILDAQTELAGYGVAINQDEGAAPEKSKGTNAPSSVPQDQVDAYNDLCVRLDLLRKKDEDYLVQGFTRSNVLVEEVDKQIADTQKTKAGLGKISPDCRLGIVSATPDETSPTSGTGLQTQVTQVLALQAKLRLGIRTGSAPDAGDQSQYAGADHHPIGTDQTNSTSQLSNSGHQPGAGPHKRSARYRQRPQHQVGAGTLRLHSATGRRFIRPWKCWRSAASAPASPGRF